MFGRFPPIVSSAERVLGIYQIYQLLTYDCAFYKSAGVSGVSKEEAGGVDILSHEAFASSGVDIILNIFCFLIELSRTGEKGNCLIPTW